MYVEQGGQPMPRTRSAGVVAAYAAATVSGGGSGSHDQSDARGTCVRCHQKGHNYCKAPTVPVVPRGFLMGGVATAARGADEAASFDRRLPFGHAASDSVSRP